MAFLSQQKHKGGRQLALRILAAVFLIRRLADIENQCVWLKAFFRETI